MRAKADRRRALVVGFTDAAQTAASDAPEGFRYLGVALYKKVVNGLIGSLPLLR